MFIPRFTEAMITIIKYRATINLMIRTSVFGVPCSVKEWKFLKPAMLAVESLIEEFDDPVCE
jgi:hypothetical protein